MSDRVDVAVVGGGAAGIAAARRLTELRRSVLLIEALPQLGGRARTAILQGLPLDLGCGWLHSARRNVLVTLAEAQGQPLDRREAAWQRQLHNLDFPVREQQAAWAAYEQLGERLHRQPPRSDTAGDALAADDRWRPFIDGVSSYINGTELDQLSVADYLAYEDASTDDNWRLPSGYGAFIVSLGAGLATALATRVEGLTQNTDIVLQTDRGTLHARAVIVAVSTTVLAQGRIRFSPAVDEHLQAASRLPLGLADKVFLSIAEPAAVPAESHLLGSYDRTATGSYYLRPFGRPVIECFLGGAWARELEHSGAAAAAAFAIGELRELLGADFARGLAPLAATRWAHEATIGGSYSHALPGHAAARALLARPVSERVCFAGEACSRTDFSTAHGAWRSGLDAADWIERGL
ncbi:MAG TPA: FAD-dependent oxidoreductase [Steroidobacteraceae bacterium]|nr:FAD-dependent oxidoreductase [Steroidobacteraceae bacterium]